MRNVGIVPWKARLSTDSSSKLRLASVELPLVHHGNCITRRIATFLCCNVLHWWIYECESRLAHRVCSAEDAVIVESLQMCDTFHEMCNRPIHQPIRWSCCCLFRPRMLSTKQSIASQGTAQGSTMHSSTSAPALGQTGRTRGPKVNVKDLGVRVPWLCLRVCARTTVYALVVRVLSISNYLNYVYGRVYASTNLNVDGCR